MTKVLAMDNILWHTVCWKRTDALVIVSVVALCVLQTAPVSQTVKMSTKLSLVLTTWQRCFSTSASS